jgi:hypothetical protein
MDRATQLQSIVKQHGGVQAMAKLFVADGKAHGVSEHELTGLAFEEAKKHALPGERHNTAFARWYSEPEQLELRKAIQIAKNTLMDMKPTVVEVGATNVESDASEAYGKLTEMANAMRAKSPTLTVAQCFARVFEDTANAELAAKAHRRPQATTSYAML